jgi:hypothetical protein
MKFMFIVKSVNYIGPSPKLMEEMQRLTKREVEAGRLIDNGVLTPMSQGAEVRVVGGRLQVIDGPYAETKEVVGGFAVFELKDKEEAVASAVEFMQLHKDHLPDWEGTCEIRAFAPTILA